MILFANTGAVNSQLINAGVQAMLDAAADALRNNMDAAEYKHVVLGLNFLKYISDAFEAKHAELKSQRTEVADPEDPDEYRTVSIFWVPKEALWAHLRASALQPKIGTIVDDAMAAIERDNTSLKGVLPKDYARPGLDKQRLGQLINMISDLGLDSPADRVKDILGRVYEYFLSQFASAEGKKGGQLYARVSTRDQNLDLQVDALKSAGCERIYQDVAGGAKTARPALDDMLGQLRAGDVLVIWKLDRMGRSLAHLVELVGDLLKRKIGLLSLNDPINTTSGSLLRMPKYGM